MSEVYLPSRLLHAMRASSDPVMPLIAARYLPYEPERERWEVGDVVCGEDHARRTYAYCGAGQWRDDVLTGQADGRHQLSEGLRLLVRRGFAICDRHWLGELLDADAVEPPYGSVVVTDDGIAHLRGDSGGWESNGNMPMTWDDLLAGAGTVRLVHWDPVADRSRGGCQDPG